MSDSASSSSPSNFQPAKAAMEFWAVTGETRKEIIGYLVTDTSRWPAPIAFVRGGTSKHAMIAVLICEGKLSPECRDDLRGRPIPHELCGRLLFPLDINMNGQPGEDRDRGYIAAMFNASKSSGAKSFIMLSHFTLGQPASNCPDETPSSDSREAK